MTKADYTHFTFVGDRTGSMSQPSEPGSQVTKAQVATKGIKDFILEQAKLGITTWSLVEFDSTSIDRVAWFASEPPEWVCQPRNSTPLLDALGITIRDTGDHLAKMTEEDRPERVYVVIATDGLENSSKEYTLDQIKKMVQHQHDAYKWEFVFIGANIDAFASGAGMGIAMAGTLNTNTAKKGAMAASYVVTTDAVTRSRVTGQSVSYSETERTAAEQGTE